MGSAIVIASVTQAFCSTGPQHTKVRRASAAIARRIFAKASAGSAKNMTPKREATCVKCAGGKACALASASMKRARDFAVAARAVATPSMGFEMSAPSTSPDGPTISASFRVVVPHPQPMSSTRAGRNIREGEKASEILPRLASMRSCNAAQR